MEREGDFYSLFLSLSKYTKFMPLSGDVRFKLSAELIRLSDAINTLVSSEDIDVKDEEENFIKLIKLYASGVRNSFDLESRKRIYKAIDKLINYFIIPTS